MFHNVHMEVSIVMGSPQQLDGYLNVAELWWFVLIIIIAESSR